jgi:hypothetical protein
MATLIVQVFNLVAPVLEKLLREDKAVSLRERWIFESGLLLYLVKELTLWLYLEHVKSKGRVAIV